jgi:hypothetical protein
MYSTLTSDVADVARMAETSNTQRRWGSPLERQTLKSMSEKNILARKNELLSV